MGERGSGKVHPWRRYFARWLDLNIYGVIGQAIAVLVLHMHTDHGALINFFINWIMLMLMLLLIEPFLLSRFGSTIGKAFFGIAVCQEDGTHLTYLQGFNRTWDVVKSGMGYMIPVYNVVRMFRCYQLYVEDGKITGISFAVEVENAGGIMSPYVMQMNVAALAYAGAQKEAAWNFTERNRVRNAIQNSGFSDFQFTYGDVEISCEKEYSGYQIADQLPYKGLLEAETGADDTYYKVVFRMKKK